MEIDIHNSRRKLELALELLEQDDRVSRRNKELVARFISQKSHVSCHTRARLVYCLRDMARWLGKDFNKVTNENMHAIFTKLSDGKIKKKDGANLSTVSINKCKRTVREFYIQFLKRKGAVAGIKANSRLKDLSVSTMWTREEILDMPNHANTLRDKAFVSLLILGCRISEIGRLLISDVNIYDDYIAINIRNSKTPCSTRTVYLFENTVHVINYLDAHPLKNDASSPLFVTRCSGTAKPISYASICNIVKKIAKEVNPDKPRNTHNFRHSIALWKHKSGMRDLELNRSMGWALGSNMKARYAACDNQMVQDEEMRIRGLAAKEERPKNVAHRCARCQTKYFDLDLDKNPHCSKCGFTMNPKIREEEMLRKQSNMELYASAVSLAKGEKRDKLAELPMKGKLDPISREEIKNILIEILRDEEVLRAKA